MLPSSRFRVLLLRQLGPVLKVKTKLLLEVKSKVKSKCGWGPRPEGPGSKSDHIDFRFGFRFDLKARLVLTFGVLVLGAYRQPKKTININLQKCMLRESPTKNEGKTGKPNFQKCMVMVFFGC